MIGSTAPSVSVDSGGPESKVLRELKAASDLTRLRILSLLWEAEDLCGCEVENLLALKQSNTSRQLNRLLAAGLLTTCKKAQWSHYQIPAPHRAPGSLLAVIINEARGTPTEGAETAADAVLQRDLAAYRDYRENGFTCQTIHQWVPFRSPIKNKEQP